MEYKDYLVEKRGHVAIVTLNRPQVLNALTNEMLGTLREICRVLNEDEDVRVAVFTGAGRGFCSGIDLRLRGQGRGQSPDLNPTNHWIAPLLALTKPTIAAVNGVAVGGGLAIALGCDIRIASETARLSAIFANIGLTVVDGIGSMLPRAVGLSKALELIYTAEIIDAREAERIGLVSRVVPPEQLMDRAMELAQRIAAGPPVALRLSKQIVYDSLHRSYLDGIPYQAYAGMLNSAIAGHDMEEGGKAFGEKRKPQFRGAAPRDNSPA